MERSRSGIGDATNRSRLAMILLAIVALWVVGSSRVEASIASPESLTRQVMNSDFVGVVRCTRAGAGMARFSVLECWKGDPAVAECVIRFHFDEFGDCFQAPARVGERFVVSANRVKRLPRRSTRIGPIPTEPWRWWGRTPDFIVRRGDAMVLIVDSNLPRNTLGFRVSKPTLERLRRAVSEIDSLPPEERELRLLREEIELSRFGILARAIPAPPSAESVAEFLSKLDATVRSKVSTDQEGTNPVFYTLCQQGLEQTLLYAKSGGALPVRSTEEARLRAQLIAAIEARLAKELEARPW